MRTKTHATIEDLYKMEGKAELVNGEIVEMPPAEKTRGEQVCGSRATCWSMKSAAGRAGHSLTASDFG